jgi:hypothetical protein
MLSQSHAMPGRTGPSPASVIAFRYVLRTLAHASPRRALLMPRQAMPGLSKPNSANRAHEKTRCDSHVTSAKKTRKPSGFELSGLAEVNVRDYINLHSALRAPF